MSILYTFFATGFYSGYSPHAPGTAGSLVAALLLGILVYCFPIMENNSLIFTPLLIASFFLIGLIAIPPLEQKFGHDPGCIVIDEFVGMWITLLFIPINWITLGIGFLLFRFFDIVKPLGIRSIDKKVKGAWGVMLDDVLAGIYANICLHLLLYLLHT